jgi:site-specific DNA recombinase
MKAIILARVSTEEQKEAGNSLPAQVSRLQNYCEKKGFEIAKKVSFDESAYKTKRDEFDRILEYLKSSKEKIVICFDKVDRFSRNVFDKRVSALYEMAMKGDVELHFISDSLIINEDISATEKFHFGMNLGLAKYYSDAISDNVKRAYEQKIRRGEFPGKAYIGYKNTTLDDGSKNIVVDQERAFLIEKMFELYATRNYSMKALTKEINKRGLKNYPSGKKLSKSQIQEILRNPFYYGAMRWKGKIYPHKYDPIISRYLFDQVQEAINSYNKQNFKITNKPYIFRGMIKCKQCGCSISPELKKGKYVYYHCTNYHGKHKKLDWIRQEDLLEQIEHLLKSIKLSPEAVKELKEELRATHESEQAYFGDNKMRIEKRLDTIRNYRKVMYEDRLEGRITTDEYDKKIEEYKKEEDDLLIQLEEHSQGNHNFYITANKIIDISQRAWEIFESSEVEEKTQLLNFLLQNCELEGKKLLYKLKTPFNGVLEYAQTGSMLRGSDSNRQPID